MSTTINSIPPLIPLPCDPTLPQSTNDHDLDIDKYATLFNPQTPPASPYLLPIFTESKPTSFIRRNSSLRQTHRHVSGRSERDKDIPALVTTPGSPDSEFGCFVSVPPAQDPLSADSSFFPFSPVPTSSSSLHFGSSLVHSTSGLTLSGSTSSPNSSQTPIPKPGVPTHHSIHAHTRNPSLDFFGQFVEDAKKKERNGRGRSYLDELLQHEDDPLYWVTAEGNGESDEGTAAADADGPHIMGGEEVKADGQALVSDLEVSLLDLESDSYFAPPSGNNGIGNGHHKAEEPKDPPRPKLKLFSTPSLSPSFPISARSPPRPLPPQRATSTSPTITSTIAGSGEHPSSSLARSSSSSSIPSSFPINDGSLTTLRSRWMSSLLSSSRPAAPSVDAHPSIDDIFSSPTSSLSDDLPHPRIQHPPTRLPLPSPSAISTLRPQQIHPYAHTHHTFPSTSISVPTSSSISHGTPFASRPFVPTSGAPGFAGDRKWDRGFSDNYFDNEREDRTSVRLEGRREMTSAVLERELVDMIRPHLPALARLPRTWSLLYSLDQHGISLNTLYARCEPQGPTSTHPKGSLVIMKDSGDVVFGAWLGEGVRVSKGSYYGSGESFLWRYVDCKLDVFKWTGKNDYVALCEHGFLSFGGGDGRYGLYLDDTLLDGSSARCPTFENEPLCSPGPKKGGSVTFECVGLEVWAIGPT